LPGAERATTTALEAIRALRAHPGREWATGFSAIASPFDLAFPGSPTEDFITDLKTLKGQLFTNAYESLRGAQGITEIEGDKATNALANLSRSQSESQFLKNLDNLEGVLQKALDTAREKSGLKPASGLPTQPRATRSLSA
jgi:hypothetical protein